MFEFNKFKYVLAVAVIFAFGYVCSSNKDDKKDDSKKDDKKTEDTKKTDDKKTDDTKKETTKSSGVKVYFVEQYKNGEEIGKSDVFLIGPNGGYFTCMIDLRGTGQKIGVGKLELRISKTSGDGEKIMDTEKFDVQPDWDYIFFDKFHTFYSSGDYKITVLKPDGTPVGTGEVTIKYR